MLLLFQVTLVKPISPSFLFLIFYSLRIDFYPSSCYIPIVLTQGILLLLLVFLFSLFFGAQIPTLLLWPVALSRFSEA